MKITDSHIHFWTFDPARHGWIDDSMQVIRKDFLPSDAEQVFSKHNVEGCVAVQADTTEMETSFLLELARQHPFIKGVIGWIDLCSENLEEQLQAYRAEPLMKGFREIMQGAPDEQFLTNKKFIEGIRTLGSFPFTYDILIYHYQLPSAVRFAEKFPEQRFILDHIAKPDIRGGEWKKWKADIRELAAHPHMYCKISGMVTEADWNRWNYDHIRPYLEIVAEFFGTERICYGSDWPVCLVAGKYGEVLRVVTEFLKQVPEAERQNVLSNNIERFYKLN